MTDTRNEQMTRRGLSKESTKRAAAELSELSKDEMQRVQGGYRYELTNALVTSYELGTNSN
jgi:bacteriocin-like protein